MSIRAPVAPNRAPNPQRADAPFVLAFGSGWRGEEGLETLPGLAEAPRSLRSYVFGRRQRGPIVIREEGVGSGPRPGPGPPAAAGGSVPPFGPAGSPWRLVLPFGSASFLFFPSPAFIYLFIFGWV